MNKSLIILTLLFLTISINGQDKKYFDSPFGGGGGYTPGWYIPNLDPLNSKLQQFGVGDLSSSGFYTSGGAGFIYVGFIPGLRIGGMGFGGGTSEEAVVNNFNREAKYTIGGGAFTAEYTLPFIKNVAISVGALIGASSLEIDLYSNRDSFNWDGVFDEISTNQSENISREIKNTFFFFSPTINVDIPLFRFTAFRIGGGYHLTFGGDWEIENGKTLGGVPSDLNANGFFIQSGIFIGFFSF